MKKLTLFTLILSLLFISACPVSAETVVPNAVCKSIISEDDTVAPASSSGCSLSFSKVSSTKAKAHASATRSNVTSITSTIRLQKKSGSSYVNTNQYDTLTVKKIYTSHTTTFTINSNNAYRIKVTIKYVENGTTYSNVYYKTLS